MAIDFTRFSQIAPFVIRCRKPLMIRGRHGVGKSEVIYQMAASVAWDDTAQTHLVGQNAMDAVEAGTAVALGMVERRVSQMTEGDLNGLPTICGDRTSWNAADWLKEACERPVCLFLDEVDRGTMEVRQGIFELTDSRKFNGWKLHPGTIICAAVNGGEDTAQYVVGEMDPAELDRWTVYDLAATPEDWLRYAKDKVHSLVWDFINSNRNHLMHDGDFEPGKVYPSPRSWFRVNEALSLMGVLDDDSPTEDDLGLAFHLSTGFIGVEAAMYFRDFIKNYDRQVTVEDVLAGRGLKKVAKWGVTEHTAFLEKFKGNERHSQDFNDAELGNLVKYMVTAPAEIYMSLFASFGEVKRHDTCARILAEKMEDGTAVADHIVAMLSPNLDEE